MGMVPQDLLGPIVAFHAEFLLSFPTAPGKLKNDLTNSLLRLSSIFRQQMDERHPTSEDGELTSTSRIPFDDYYTAEVLVLAFSVVLREFSVPQEIMEEAVHLAFRFLRLCVHNLRHYSSDFAHRTGYSWVGRILELETAANNLVFCLEQRYILTEELGVLDEAMRLCREALRLPNIKSSTHLALLYKLASLLKHRVIKYEDTNDVEEAIAVAEQCLGIVTDDFHRGTTHSYLTEAYELRYRYEQLQDDLEKALTHGAKAVEFGSERDMAAVLMHYASVLETKYFADNRLSDLDQAIELSRDAMNHPSMKPHNYRAHSSNFAGLLFKRMEATDDEQQRRKYAAECLEYIEEALKHAAAGFHSRTLLTKARLLISTKSPYHNIHASLEVMKELVEDEAYPAGERIECVTKFWNETQFFDTDGITREVATLQRFLDVVVFAAHLLPRFANFHLAVRARLKTLQRVAEGLTLTAAISAMSLGQNGLALEMIEEGRATFWSQALNLRGQHGLDGLPEELRQAIAKRGAFLEEGSFQQPSVTVSADHLPQRDQIMSSRRQAAAEFLELVERARKIPGFERFMCPHSASYLCTAAKRGPIVLLVTDSDDECFALLIRTDGSIGRLPLLLSLATVDKLVKMWDVTSRRVRQFGRDGSVGEEQVVSDNDEIYQIVKEEFRLASERAVKKHDKTHNPTHAQCVLMVLWVFVVRPILAALNISKPTSATQRGRIWWCVTRSFAHLPVHAAGWYPDNGVSDCCSDYVVSSYTPTLQALIDARKSYRPVKLTDARVLLGAAPRPYKGTRTPATVHEVRRVAQTVHADRLVPLDYADDALRNTSAGGISVGTALNRLAHEQVTILHIASHGLQDPYDPLSSGFLLRDGKLTVLDLMRTRLHSSTLLAFLSACETAKMSEDFAHETVHLAATMLFAGFKSVVGTLWPMSDFDGPDVAGRVYTRLFHGNDEYLNPEIIPIALDEAVRELRAKNVSPSRWATYIHIGI